MSFVDGVIAWTFATYTPLGRLCHTPSSLRNGRMANATSWTREVFIPERVLKALVFRFEVFRRQTRPGVDYVAPVLSGPNEPRR